VVFSLSIGNIIYSQWIVGPTVSGIGPNPTISAATPVASWLVGGSSSPVIYKTTNHGLNWVVVPTGGILATLPLYAVWGTDANTAYVGNGTGNSSVYKTTNGGTNWVTLFTDTGATCFFNGIVFSRSTPAFGIAQSDPPLGAGSTYYVQLTTDGGTTWNVLSPPPPGNTGYVASQHSPFVIDRNFWGFGCNGGGIVDITTNGGLNWSSSYVGRSGFVSALTFSSDKLNGIAAVTGSGLSRTTNGGANWTTFSVTGIDGASLSFAYWLPYSNVVYASSAGGGIFRSTNWGANWSQMTTGGQTDILHMDFVVNGGLIYGYAIAGTGATLTLVDTTTILPVQMAYFNYSLSNNNVELQWQTEFEINNSGFAIERSKAGSVWERIGFVEGNGTKPTPSNYQYSDNSLGKGIYTYRLKQIDYNGNFQYYSLNSDVSVGAPNSFYLFQNFPNPFNPSTSINFNLPFDGKVQLVIYDITGREVASLINSEMQSGYYSRVFDASNLASGVYFYKLTAQSPSSYYSDVKKMALVK